MRAAVACALAWGLIGCGGGLPRCRRAVEEKRFDPAIALCGGLLEGGREPEAALWQVRAFLGKGQREQAVAVTRRHADRRTEAFALMGLATAQDTRSAAEAMSLYRRAADLFCAAGDHAGCSDMSRGEGRAAWQLARYGEALLATVRSVDEARAAGDRVKELKALLGAFTIVHEQGDLPASRRTLQEAAAVAGLVRDPALQNLIVFNQALVDIDEGNHQAARAGLQKLIARQPGPEVEWTARLDLFTTAIDDGDPAEIRSTLAAAQAIYDRDGRASSPFSRAAFGYHRARAARLLGRPREAIAIVDGVLGPAISDDWRWNLVFERAEARSTLGDDAAARAGYEEAVAIIDRLRQGQFDQFRSWLLVKNQGPYRALLDLTMRAGDARGALSVMERMQGRTFLDVFTAAMRRSETGEPLRGISSRLAALSQLYPSLAASPALAPLPVDRLLTRLAGDHLLQYFETRDRLYLMVVARGVPTVRRLEVTVPELQTAVSAFALAGKLADQTLARRLGDILLPAGSLPRGGTVFVAPSASLARLPFAALRPGGALAIQRHAFAYVPSASALVALRDRRRSPSGRFAVFADAGGDLPSAAAEGRAVAARIGGRLFAGGEATAAHLRQVVDAPLLHFAVHSGFGPTGAWLGLSDGRLSASDLVAVAPRSQLVVLATCASAATEDPGLWGSLAAAFLAAGTPSVIASLSSVEDDPSARLMAAFYERGGASDPLGALSEVQRDWARTLPPERWAPFVYFGTGAKVAAEPSGAVAAHER
jgi:tetratricopeptide (TPR) repeat protein